MTVAELERALHEDTVQAYRELISNAAGRDRRRLEGEFRQLEAWVPHWHVQEEQEDFDQGRGRHEPGRGSTLAHR